MSPTISLCVSKRLRMRKTKLDWIRYIVLLPMGYMRSAFNVILVIKPVVKSRCVHSIMYSLVLLQ